jgi:hypothetical protein
LHEGGGVEVFDAAKEWDNWAVLGTPLKLLVGLGEDAAVGEASLEAGSGIYGGAKVCLDHAPISVGVWLEDLF